VIVTVPDPVAVVPPPPAAAEYSIGRINTLLPKVYRHQTATYPISRLRQAISRLQADRYLSATAPCVALPLPACRRATCCHAQQ